MRIYPQTYKYKSSNLQGQVPAVLSASPLLVLTALTA